MTAPYAVGDEVAYLSLNEVGLRAQKATVREVNGNQIGISPPDDRAAHAVTHFSVNEAGEAPEIVNLDPELRQLMGDKNYTIFGWSSEITEAERTSFEQQQGHRMEHGYGY